MKPDVATICLAIGLVACGFSVQADEKLTALQTALSSTTISGYVSDKMAGASTLTVTSVADSGPGTLRDALADAADGDTIDATRIHGTIQLTSGELFVGRSVVIAGPGPAHLAVDGNTSSRGFHIGPGVVVELTGLTITNGVAPYQFGGGIYNDHATLIVSNCVIIGNFGGQGAGIANDGYSGNATLVVVNSLVRGNMDPIESTSGGGILNLGQNGNAVATLVNSIVSDNVAGFLGGGIFNNGWDGIATVTIVNSTVKNNNAGWSGGGIYNAGWDGTASLILESSTVNGNQAGIGGGGVYNAGYGGTASLAITNCAIIENWCLYNSLGGGLCNGLSGGDALMTLVNSTISENSADYGGGIFSGYDYAVPIPGPGDASLQILNCTLSDNSVEAINLVNGAGTGTVEIGSTIINASAPGSTISGGSSTVTSLGYNLSSDDGGGVLTNATDLINTNPRLGPLQDNGGSSFTHALLPGSPAIDQGKNFSGALYDQRGLGFARTFDFPFIPNASGGDGTDIGAFEVQPACLNPVQVVRHLLDLVNAQWKRPQPLRATLDAALASIGRNNLTAAINQLQAFENQVRAQVQPSDPALAAVLLEAAQNAINTLNAGRYY
jgi:hypothetical protein